MSRARILLGGVALPILLVVLAWIIPPIWTDLPDTVPSLWRGPEAVSSLPLSGYLFAWGTGAAFLATLTIAVAVSALVTRSWGPLARGLIAVGAGATGAVVAATLVPLALLRGATGTGLGATPGLIALGGGFVVVGLLTVAVLPSRARESA